MQKEDKGILQSDLLERKAMKRIDTIYNDALATALEKESKFFNTIKGLDEKLSDKTISDAQRKTLEGIKATKIQEFKHYQRTSKSIAKEMAQAGVQSTQVIKDTLVDVYSVNNKQVIRDVHKYVDTVDFTIYDKNQIAILLNDTQAPFTKIAYKNLGKNKIFSQRLQNALAQATLLGESQDKIIKRIQEITGQSAKQAKRVAQTERNRVQSQARYNTMQEAQELGVKMAKRWSTRMVNSRETHIALDGAVVGMDETFANGLLYPGDPRGEASETINCFCVMIPIVLKPDGTLYEWDKR